MTRYSHLWFPVKYVPESLPGVRFKRLARYYRDATSQMISGPVEFVKNELVTPFYNPQSSCSCWLIDLNQATNNGRVDNSVYAQFHKQMSEEQKTIDTAIRFEAATNAIASAYAGECVNPTTYRSSLTLWQLGQTR